ncbi:hypothetical protein ACFC1B_25440, partial [Streptomyces xiamenensis]
VDERVDDVGPQVPVADGTATGERERSGAGRAGDPAGHAREASTRDGRAPVAGSAAGGADARPAGRPAGAPRGPGGPERLPGKGPGAVFVVAGWSPGTEGPDGVPVPDGAAGLPVGAHGALTAGSGEGPDAGDSAPVRGTEPAAPAVPPPATDAESGALAAGHATAADSPSTSASTSASPSAAGANGGGHAHG